MWFYGVGIETLYIIMLNMRRSSLIVPTRALRSDDGTLMPPLALRMIFLLLGSASAGCLPLLELSDALRARAEKKK